MLIVHGPGIQAMITNYTPLLISPKLMLQNSGDKYKFLKLKRLKTLMILKNLCGMKSMVIIELYRENPRWRRDLAYSIKVLLDSCGVFLENANIEQAKEQGK